MSSKRDSKKVGYLGSRQLVYKELHPFLIPCLSKEKPDAGVETSAGEEPAPASAFGQHLEGVAVLYLNPLKVGKRTARFVERDFGVVSSTCMHN